MGLGVLEDTKLDHVPGTAYVVDDATRRTEEEGATVDSNLKYDTSGRVPVILVPQPSDDPNDPLNWSTRKKDAILFTLSLLGVIVSTLSPILAADSVAIAQELGITFNKVALLTGYNLLGVGIGGFIFVPSSRVWGKRHAFLLGTIIVVISSAWAGSTGLNYTSHLWARIIQGIGLAPFESLVNATVGDLYFVHERGKRMAISNFAVFGGAFMTPVIVGKMASVMGWKWSYYFVAIFSGIFLPILVFFVPETAYRRDESLNTDMNMILQGHRRSKVMHTTELRDRTPTPDPLLNDFEKTDSRTNTRGVSQAPLQTVSYWKSLMPFNGRKTDESYWKLALRPLPLFLHPGILWACLIQGALIGWTVFIGIVLAAIMLSPPLFFDEVKTGYMYTSAFVGAIIGFLLAGILSDSVTSWLTRRNRGVYEPEFRLFLVIPQLILGCAGLYGFGITSADTYKYGWFWPDFFFALEVAGMVVGAVASSLYVVDAHRNIAVEAFTCMMIFKNIFSFGLTWSGYQWLIKGGIKNVFVAVASVQVGICLLTVPLYIFGKKNRSFFARYDILKMLGLW